jgi:hypothetical protein
MDTAIQMKQLRALRQRVEVLNDHFQEDLLSFLKDDQATFSPIPEDKKKADVSVTTTCTVLMALTTAYQMQEFYSKALSPSTDNTEKAFTAAASAKWTSEDLKPDNAFTTTVVLRTAGILWLRDQLSETLVKSTVKHNGKGLEEIALERAEFAPDSLSVEGYPPNPAILYWFIDAVDNLGTTLAEERWIEIAKWAARQFSRHLSLVAAGHDAMMDPIAMGMAACLCARLRQIATKPTFANGDKVFEQLPSAVELQHGIQVLFGLQGLSGIWPKYFPLFHYPEAGANYCFSFELLEAILHEFSECGLFEKEDVFKGLQKAVTWCELNRLEYRPGPDVYCGWNSGGQITTLNKGIPESWATAVIHMFLFRLSTELSELIENRIRISYDAKLTKKEPSKWNELLDSSLPPVAMGTPTTVKRLLEVQIIEKIEKISQKVPRFSKLKTRTSVLLFGPPGTSKTSVVRALAKRIGWPCVELNPSNFLNEGLEKIYVRADEIFDDLMNLSRTVVLLDEMDALAQRRTSEGTEERLDVTREFLTTSMLPKIAKLHDERRVLFFMATNHQKNFDDAIKRPGRFDLLIFMGPPSWAEKLLNLDQFWPRSESNGDKTKIDEDKRKVKDALSSWIGETDKDKTRELLELFTFGEMKSLLEEIASGKNLRETLEKTGEKGFRTIVEAWGDKDITLRKKDRGKKNPVYEEYVEDRELSRIQ